jgi:hypothetical protein
VYVVGAVVVAIIVLLAGIYFLGPFLGLVGSRNSAVGGTGHRLDFCNETQGVDCSGDIQTVPYAYGGGYENVTGCDAVPSRGSPEVLYLNYTPSAPVYGIVVPQGLFSGSGSWSVDPAGFVVNSTELRQAAWFSGFSSNPHFAVITVPQGQDTWCLSWWEPQGSVTITLDSDLAITYQSPP